MYLTAGPVKHKKSKLDNTLTTANAPEYRGTGSPRRCFTWLVKTKIAAPVVKPLIIGSDR